MSNEDEIRISPVLKDGEKEASKEDAKVMMDKTSYEGPKHTNPLDAVDPDLHSK